MLFKICDIYKRRGLNNSDRAFKTGINILCHGQFWDETWYSDNWLQNNLIYKAILRY